MNTPTPAEIELIEKQINESDWAYFENEGDINDRYRTLDKGYQVGYKSGAKFGYDLGAKSRDAEINRVVYELDKSRDSNRIIITALEEKLRWAREALEFYGDKRQKYFVKGIDQYGEGNDNLGEVFIHHKAKEALAKLDDQENG